MTERRMLKPYDVQVALSVGRDEAWKAVTTPTVLRQWFGWDYDGLDAEIRHIFVDQAAVLAERRIGWADGSYLEVDGDDATSTARAVREGRAPDDPDAYDAIEEGWRAFLTQLVFYLRTRPKRRRRTVYLTGETTGHQVLGLVPGEWTTVGSRTAWIVDPDRHLVVVSGRRPLHSPVAARAEVTISTYGLNDVAFEACREEWAKRWASVTADAAVTVADSPAPR